ncbi:MAG: hypothetical protein H6810_11550 [Phycisphaeraceae bacterium]|nr:MAG: hypothetical protein H6810_11550 [Phycisphaeraceae bacterium]
MNDLDGPWHSHGPIEGWQSWPENAGSMPPWPPPAASQSTGSQVEPSPPTNLQWARVGMRLGRYDDAVRLYQEHLDAFPLGDLGDTGAAAHLSGAADETPPTEAPSGTTSTDDTARSPGPAEDTTGVAVRDPGEPTGAPDRVVDLSDPIVGVEFVFALAAADRPEEAAPVLQLVYTAFPDVAGARVTDWLPLRDREWRAMVVTAVKHANKEKSASAWLLVSSLMAQEGRNEVALRMLERAREAGLDAAIADPMARLLGGD